MKPSEINQIIDGSNARFLSIMQCDPLTREALRLATALTHVVDQLNEEVEALKTEVERLTASAAAAPGPTT